MELKLLSIFVFFSGMLFFGGCLVFRLYRRHVFREEVTATCISLEMMQKSGEPAYIPTREYTYQGVSYTKRSIFGYNQDELKEGDQWTLHIDPDKPTRCRFQGQIYPVSFMIFGVIRNVLYYFPVVAPSF